jgi:DDE_Tnp_1-like zinc-ribbon
LHRGGVDTVDQLRGNYAMARKSMKNWPSLAWWLIDMCIVNAYRLFSLQTRRSVSQLEFRIALMQQLAAAYPPHRAPGGRAPPARLGRPSGPHFPALSDKALDCAYCSSQATRRKRSRYVCDHCPVHLCVTPCFKLYHARHHQVQ